MTKDNGNGSGTEGRIVTERRGPLLLIGIDRPAKLNAFTPEMMAALSAAYSALDDDPGLRCGVLFALSPNVVAGGRSGNVTSRVSLSSGIKSTG